MSVERGELNRPRSENQRPRKGAASWRRRQLGSRGRAKRLRASLPVRERAPGRGPRRRHGARGISTSGCRAPAWSASCSWMSAARRPTCRPHGRSRGGARARFGAARAQGVKDSAGRARIRWRCRSGGRGGRDQRRRVLRVPRSGALARAAPHRARHGACHGQSRRPRGPGGALVAGASGSAHRHLPA